MTTEPRRLVYVVETPLSERDATRFGLDILQQRGFAVEAWEVDALFLPSSRKQSLVPAVGRTVRTITTTAELHSLCSGLSSRDIVISLFGYNRGQRMAYAPLRQALAECPARVAAISVGVRPVRAIGWSSVACNALADPKRALADSRTLVTRVAERLRGGAHRVGRGNSNATNSRMLDWLFVSTVTTYVDPDCIGSATEIGFIHSLDYDLVLQQTPRPAADGEYLLFLDSMGPLHPDYDTLGLERGPTTPDEYFSIVCRVLRTVEEATGLPVRVAAHPRAPLGMLEPLYGNRPVDYGQTAALLASARAVLMAFPSTAIGMAVAFRRPMTLIVSKGFDPFVREEAEIHIPLLQLDVIDADQPLAAWRVPEVSAAEYAAYEAQFVAAPDSPRLPFWEVVANTLESTGRPPVPE